MVVTYKNQQYSSLRRHAVSSGRAFVDPEFPPTNKSLFRTDPGNASRGIEWKRPKVGDTLSKLFYCRPIVVPRVFVYFVRYIYM